MIPGHCALCPVASWIPPWRVGWLYWSNSRWCLHTHSRVRGLQPTGERLLDHQCPGADGGHGIRKVSAITWLSPTCVVATVVFERSVTVYHSALSHNDPQALLHGQACADLHPHLQLHCAPRCLLLISMCRGPCANSPPPSPNPLNPSVAPCPPVAAVALPQGPLATSSSPPLPQPLSSHPLPPSWCYWCLRATARCGSRSCGRMRDGLR